MYELSLDEIRRRQARIKPVPMVLAGELDLLLISKSDWTTTNENIEMLVVEVETLRAKRLAA